MIRNCNGCGNEFDREETVPTTYNHWEMKWGEKTFFYCKSCYPIIESFREKLEYEHQRHQEAIQNFYLDFLHQCDNV